MRSVELTFVVPSGAAEMRIAESLAGLALAGARIATTPVSWSLSSGDGRKTVYVSFTDGSGATLVTVSDSIVLDTVAPKVSVPGSRVMRRNADGSRVVRVDLTASGTGSALVRYQVTSSISRPGTWRSYADPFLVTTRSRTLYVRVRDAAGNPSPWRTFYPAR